MISTLKHDKIKSKMNKKINENKVFYEETRSNLL